MEERHIHQTPSQISSTRPIGKDKSESIAPIKTQLRIIALGPKEARDWPTLWNIGLRG